jgi:two-component system response regulator YesN
MQNRIITIANDRWEKQKEAATRLNRCFRIMQENIPEHDIYHLTMGVGPAVDMSALKTSYLNAVHAIDSRPVRGVDKVIDYSSHTNPLPRPDAFFDYKWTDIKKDIEIQDTVRLADDIDTFFRRSAPVLAQYPYFVYEWAEKLLLELADLLVESNIAEETQFNKNMLLEKLFFCWTLESIKEYIKNVVGKVFDNYFEKAKLSDRKTIQEAKEYIYANYNKKINLNDVANRVYLSPAYFGILFKKETGLAFTDFIAGLRIEKAKELLQKLDYSVAMVSGEVGYKDTRYFNKLFKKIVGVTASEYKKIRRMKKG